MSAILPPLPFPPPAVPPFSAYTLEAHAQLHLFTAPHDPRVRRSPGANHAAAERSAEVQASGHAQDRAWGYYDAAAPPVLRIHSGDTVVFDTLITNSPTGLEKAGVPRKVEQSLRDIYKEVTNKGPGGHILNGPVLCGRSRARRHAGSPHTEDRSGHSVRLQRLWPHARLSAGRFSLSPDEDHSAG